MPVSYSFSQQQRDFIKLQFKYAVRLKEKLAAGEITQDYYDSHVWLTTQTLESPYAGWWDEFKLAIDQENLDWLANQVGETTEELSRFIGKTAGGIVGGTIGGISEGLATGLFTRLGFFGWLTVAAVGVGIYFAFKTGLAQKAIKKSVSGGLL